VPNFHSISKEGKRERSSNNGFPFVGIAPAKWHIHGSFGCLNVNWVRYCSCIVRTVTLHQRPQAGLQLPLRGFARFHRIVGFVIVGTVLLFTILPTEFKPGSMSHQPGSSWQPCNVAFRVCIFRLPVSPDTQYGGIGEAPLIQCKARSGIWRVQELLGSSILIITNLSGLQQAKRKLFLSSAACAKKLFMILPWRCIFGFWELPYACSGCNPYRFLSIGVTHKSVLAQRFVVHF
jgi:hypothetical protein